MKNQALEFWRFMFAIVICLYHYRSQVSKNFMPSGYLAVEFFFAVSGYLLAQSALKATTLKNDTKNAEAETLHFIVGKIKRLWPHYILSFVVFSLLSVFLLNRYSLIHVFRFGLPEFFMLQMSGLSNADFTGNAADWYVSSLLIASFICYYFCYKNFKTFCYILSPIISLMGYTYLYHEFGHLGTMRAFRIIFYTGTVRAFTGICLGCICFVFVTYIKNNFIMTIRAKIILSITDIICIGLIILRFCSEWKTTKDFLMLPVFCIFIISIFLNESFVEKALDVRISNYLGKISYAIFLNHTIIRDIFKHIKLDIIYKTSLYLAVIIIYSMLTTYLIDKFEEKRLSVPTFLGLKRK